MTEAPGRPTPDRPAPDRAPSALTDPPHAAPSPADPAPADPAPAGPDGGSPERIVRCWLEFDGSGFEGWQRQREARTVQGTVEAALEEILQAPHPVVGCGRTDAGVHSLGLVASFRTRHTMPAAELARALDAVLPADIGVMWLEDAPSGFHAQRDAVWKWYRYRLLVSRRKRPLSARGAWRTARIPELEAMQAAANAFVGTHDYASFANTGSSPGASTVRTVHLVEVRREPPHVVIDVVGGGFLYKMVRTLVGTLLDVAGGGAPADAMARVLAARDRTAAGRAVPADGLCLMAVGLDGEPTPAWLPAHIATCVGGLSLDRLEART